MVYPREVLNRLRWKEGESLRDAIIWYVHRGAPEDVRRISGEDIVALGKGFFDTREATIPYHRILKIEHKGMVLFLRNAGAAALK